MKTIKETAKANNMSYNEYYRSLKNYKSLMGYTNQYSKMVWGSGIHKNYPNCSQMIRNIINIKTKGIKFYPYSIRAIRNSARPIQIKMKEILQNLSNEELNVGFHLELIGNNNHNGLIVKNSQRL